MAVEGRVQEVAFTIDNHVDSQRNSTISAKVTVEDTMNAGVHTTLILDLFLKLSTCLYTLARPRSNDERAGGN